MINIVICEDEDFQRNNLEKAIYKIIDDLMLDMDIVLSTDDENKVIEYSKKNRNNNNLYFFDVELKNNVNGIEKASQIRKEDSKSMIVFVTSHSEMSLLTFEYKVQAFDYIVKNSKNFHERVKECLMNANKEFNEVSDEEGYILIESSERIQKQNIRDILFIETANNHKIRIHTIDSIIEIYGTIKDYEEKLTEGFMKVHRSYLVNLKNIKNVDKSNKILEMINGEKCLISRLCIKEVLKCVK